MPGNDDKKKVLIVDDDSANLISMTHILISDYTILTAKNGADALKIAKKFVPDVILLDVIMPEMDGYQVIAELKNSDITKDIPVIFITGLDGSEDEETGLALGAADYMSKTLSETIMKLRIRHQIQNAGQMRMIENLNRALERALEDAKAANKAKSAFLANMNHEIRTPMNTILGITEILMQDESIVPEHIDKIYRIYSAGNLLLGIINDILDLSKFEAGKLKLVAEQYETANLINETAQINLQRFKDKPVDFKVEVDENIPAAAIGDILRIKQILTGLLSNAAEYTQEGEVVLAVSAEDKAEGGDTATFVFSVRDTGIGMSKAETEELFKEHSRFSNEDGRRTEGTGLGLSNTYNLVKMMNGEICVESEEGKGSVFTVKIPQGKAGTRTLGNETAEMLRQFRADSGYQGRSKLLVHEPMPYGSVLVVDDNESNLYVASGLLKPYRLKIDMAMSGRDALSRIKGGKVYDVIFMDHMMPDMDGIETAGRIRELGYKEPIVALTANAVAGQTDMFLDNGFDDFISKPVDIRKLDAILAKLIRGKQPADVIEEARKQYSTDKPADIESLNKDDSLLIDSFIRDAERAISSLDEMLVSESYKNAKGCGKYTVIVHGMKSSLYNTGNTALAETAAMLEQAGNKQNTGLIASITPGFVAELRSLCQRLRSRRDEGSRQGGEDGQDDIEALREKLLAVQEQCADYNRKGALDIIAGIKECSKQTKKLLSDVKSLVMGSEFEEAESAVGEYLDKLSAGTTEQEPPIGASPEEILMRSTIEGLDISSGMSKFNNDAVTYLKILRSYSDETRRIIGSIEEAGTENLKQYIIAVHSIKGTSNDIFACSTGQSAKELETAAKNGDIDYINKHHGPFCKNTRRLIDDIDNMIEVINAENPKPKKDKPDPELLSQLAEACKEFSMDGAEAVMGQIDAFEYEDDGGLAKWLRKNVDLANFAEIAKKLT